MGRDYVDDHRFYLYRAGGGAEDITRWVRQPQARDVLEALSVELTFQALRHDSEEAAAKVGIKWPNDIVVDGKKVCGILTEMSMEQGYIQHIVIGVGINVRKQEFPEEIRDRAAAIDEQCGFRISRSQLIADIMEAFEEDYEIFLRTHDLKGLRASYAELLVNQDREVCVLDPKGEYRGIARGINDQGELLVERQDGTVEEVYAGEVSVRGIYGYV